MKLISIFRGSGLSPPARTSNLPVGNLRDTSHHCTAAAPAQLRTTAKLFPSNPPKVKVQRWANAGVDTTGSTLKHPAFDREINNKGLTFHSLVGALELGGALLVGLRSTPVFFFLVLLLSFTLQKKHAPFWHVVSMLGVSSHFGVRWSFWGKLRLRTSRARPLQSCIRRQKNPHLTPRRVDQVGSCWSNGCCRSERVQTRKLGPCTSKKHVFDHLELCTIWNCAIC